MTKKSQKTGEVSGGQVIQVEGGIHAGHDVVQGNQINYGNHDFKIMNITTPGEFVAKLGEIQAKIASMKQQTDLTSAQKRNLATAEAQIVKAGEEAQKPNVDSIAIQQNLTEVKETFDLLSSSIASAAGLGAVLGNLIAMAVRMFGG